MSGEKDKSITSAVMRSGKWYQASFPFRDSVRCYSVAPSCTADSVFSGEEHCISSHLGLSWIIGIHTRSLSD